MTIKRKLKEIEFEYLDDAGNSEIFVVREPTVEENNAADLIRSNAFFDAVDKGIRTETEILSRLREQGRFNEDDYREECDRLGAKLRDLLIELATANSKEKLIELHKEAREAREALMDKYRYKETFLQHSAEQKGENAVNLALLGVCLEKKDGTPFFAMVKKDTNELDIESTYKKVYNYENDNFITYALSYFLPLVMGVDRDIINEHSEDSVFKDRMFKLTGEENVATPSGNTIKTSQYSPNKTEDKKVVSAPPRKKDDYETNIDIAKDKDQTIVSEVLISNEELPELKQDIPDFNLENKETAPTQEAKLAPIAPVFDAPSMNLTPTPILPMEKSETIESSETPIELQKEGTVEEVIKMGGGTSTLRSRSDKDTISDGSAKPYGVWTPPIVNDEVRG